MDPFNEKMISELTRELQLADRYQVIWNHTLKLRHRKPKTFRDQSKYKLLKQKLLIPGLKP